MKNNFMSFIFFLTIPIIGCDREDNTAAPNLTQGEWKIVRNADSANLYWKLFFADVTNGWAVGNSGIILCTTDGGNSWNTQASGTVNSLKCVYFADTQKGWIGGGSNSIGMTTNGGSTWSWQYPAGETNRTFMSMSFVNEQTGWIVDNYGGILHTEDSGINWTPQTSGTSWAITSVQFLDTQEGWAAATNRVVLHTTNGGNNWITKILDTLDYGNGNTVIFNDVFFINHSIGWIAATSVGGVMNSTAPIVHTSNAGSTWICQPQQTSWTAALQFVNENTGWAAGENGILYTSDSGITWTCQQTESSSLFVDICFIDQSHGWALTSSGNIYKYQK